MREAWIGWHLEKKWVLLDRRITEYEDENLAFLELENMRTFTCPRKKWNPPQITFWERHIEKETAESKTALISSLDRCLKRWMKHQKDIRGKKAERLQYKRLDGIEIKVEKRLVDRSINIFCSAIDVGIRNSAPKLNEKDIELCELWRNGNPDRFETTKMESARQAEIVAREIYKQMYGSCKDIAMLQLDDPKCQDWKRADLYANGRNIDVKNARTSFATRGTPMPRYSEYCIPRFKTERDDRFGQQVKICAILSEYSKYPVNDPRYQEKETTWLGETCENKLQEIKNEFQSEYLHLDFKRKNRGKASFLPPWVFEYPNTAYQNKKQWLQKLRKEIPCGLRYHSELPLEIILGKRSSHRKKDPLEFIRCIQRFSKVQISRTTTFMHVLDRFSQCCLNNQPFNSQDIDECLYFKSDKSKSSPLGCYDPIGTVKSLIETLSSVSENAGLKIKGFRTFRLVGSGIFQGKKDGDTMWRTIIAYCGGWNHFVSSAPNGVRCGVNPLHIGSNKTCTECGKLICRTCEFCQENCNSGQKRVGARKSQNQTTDL